VKDCNLDELTMLLIVRASCPYMLDFHKVVYGIAVLPLFCSQTYNHVVQTCWC